MLEQTFSGLWYINSAFALRMHDIILPRLRAGKEPLPASYLQPRPQSMESNSSGNSIDWDLEDLKSYLKAGGGDVAVIPIDGAMSRYGLCGYGNEYTARILEKAQDFAKVKSVVLKINTPGGTVDSTEMLADTVKNFSKPIVAWTPYCASAGVFVASQADEIILEPSVTAEIGSIGVLMVYTDYSKYLEKEGMDVQIFRAEGSEDKALINGIEPLTDELKAEIQADLNACRKAFLGYVKRGRAGRLKSNEVFSGKMYKKEQAIQLGLADKIGSLNDAIKRARKL
ncbi:MAG: S49 family peptidase [Bacteroidetes bacterium]|nr:S49 family peptidase [Bacteroidota bacterium]